MALKREMLHNKFKRLKLVICLRNKKPEAYSLSTFIYGFAFPENKPHLSICIWIYFPAVHDRTVSHKLVLVTQLGAEEGEQNKSKSWA